MNRQRTDVAHGAPRRSRLRLPVAVAAIAIGAGAPAALAATAPAPAAGTQAAPSVFAQDLPGSRPQGLVPSDGAVFAYPADALVLRWDPVPGAGVYHVEIADNPAFTNVVWKGDSEQAAIVPDKLLQDGEYWWRVSAADAAGTAGAMSAIGHFFKTWPNQIAGLAVTDRPGGAPTPTFAFHPYFSWNPVLGAKEYELQVAPADLFGSPFFSAIHNHVAFDTPSTALGFFPDDSYQVRVRAHDANDNAGPWTVSPPFSRVSPRATAIEPAAGASVSAPVLRWDPTPGAASYELQVGPSAANMVSIATPEVTSHVLEGLLPGATRFWRVRPVFTGVNGTIPGGWSSPRSFTVVAPATTTLLPVLTTVPTLSDMVAPVLRWSAVHGLASAGPSAGTLVDATVYRVDLATDPNFNNIISSHVTDTTAFAPAGPLPDNQSGTGYWWRVVWGTGSAGTPLWQSTDDEASATASSTFQKQTVITTTFADGTSVAEPPMLSWNEVPGALKYEVVVSSSPSFDTAEPGTPVTTFGTGLVPGSTQDAKRLGDGTWYWRVRPIDTTDAPTGKGAWSPPQRFILSSPAPDISGPADGAVSVGPPLLRWAPLTHVCSYDVQIKDAGALVDGDPVVSAVQTALVPRAATVAHAGSWYWRVRGDYCDSIKGAWSPVHRFVTTAPPDMGLGSVPPTIDFGRSLNVAGAVSFAGARVNAPSVTLERRLAGESAYTPVATVRGDASGQYLFKMAPRVNGAYRVRWSAGPGVPDGLAAFAVKVAPKATLRLRSAKVARGGKLRITGTVSPARKVLVQAKTAKGWITFASFTPRSTRFNRVIRAVVTGRGKVQVRLLVPGDATMAAGVSAPRKVRVFDIFRITKVRR
jgi:hypothetical protein